jgi:hypothetical protein
MIGSDLTDKEKRNLRVFERALKKWRKILLIDPIWDISLVVVEDDIMEDGLAAVDMSLTEYFSAIVMVKQSILSRCQKDIKEIADEVARHELIHIITADYQRAIISALGKKDALLNQINYVYEQVVFRLGEVVKKLGKK